MLKKLRVCVGVELPNLILVEYQFVVLYFFPTFRRELSNFVGYYREISKNFDILARHCVQSHDMGYDF